MLDVGAGAGITVNADSVQVANDGITNAMLADGAVNLGTADVTGTLPLDGGGTGQTTAKAARETGLGCGRLLLERDARRGHDDHDHAGDARAQAPRAACSCRCSSRRRAPSSSPDVAVAANGDVTVTFGASVTANSRRVTIIG